jgi:hypothetical protein
LRYIRDTSELSGVSAVLMIGTAIDTTDTRATRRARTVWLNGR